MRYRIEGSIVMADSKICPKCKSAVLDKRGRCPYCGYVVKVKKHTRRTGRADIIDGRSRKTLPGY